MPDTDQWVDPIERPPSKDWEGWEGSELKDASDGLSMPYAVLAGLGIVLAAICVCCAQLDLEGDLEEKATGTKTD